MSKARTLVAPPPTLIDDTNLSRAWARLLLQVFDGAGTEVAPIILSLSGFAQNGQAVEDPAVRRALDQLLVRKGHIVVDNVAFTIFPQRLWEMSRGDRTRLFARYSATFPRWQAINRKANGRGLYFERMVMYGRGPCEGNQLEWIFVSIQFAEGCAPLDVSSDHLRSGSRPCRQCSARFSLPSTGELRADRRRTRYQRPSTPPSRFSTKPMVTISA